MMKPLCYLCQNGGELNSEYSLKVKNYGNSVLYNQKMKGPDPSHRKTEAKLWLDSFANGMFSSGQQMFVMEGLGGRLHVVKTTYWMMIVSCPFLRCFGQWITVKLYYETLQRQLSQGCTIFIDSYYVICKNYVRLCRNLRIMQLDVIYWSIMQNCTIAQYQRPCLWPTHFVIVLGP